MVKTNKLNIDATKSVLDENFDSYLIIASNLEADLKGDNFVEFISELSTLKKINKNFEKDVTYTVINKRLVIYSPTGPLNRDQDDVRRIQDASVKAIEKAITCGSRKPLVINTVKSAFEQSNIVSILGVLHAAYLPLELREVEKTDNPLKVDKVGFWHENLDEAKGLIDVVNAIEIGRIIARDIGGSDPERMAAPRIADYVHELFHSTDVKVHVVQGQQEFEKHYPCFAAVNRAAEAVPRHRGRVIKLEYNPSDKGEIDTTLFLVGKGITYDTGGADVKHGGHMAGMHRDKCGAAFVAGFFKTLALLKPKGLKVYGFMCVARNSIGEECYVADEIITARSKRRVRVGNTDAEGRMVMVDLLNEAKDLALNETNPQLFTIATLTGHAIRAYGPAYSAIMCNGPARKLDIDKKFFQVGDTIGDPFEISTIRREDFKVVAGKSEYEDLLQSTNNPSTLEPRGHQFPAAFLIVGSGLDEHGNQSEKKLPYTHLDIAGSSGPFPGIPTGCPLPSFTYNYIVPRL